MKITAYTSNPVAIARHGQYILLASVVLSLSIVTSAVILAGVIHG